MSRKPRVATMAALGSLRVISALVATVVPWVRSAISAGVIPAAAMLAMTAASGWSGRDGTLVTEIAPVASSKK
ncbi:MAG: hypothetical protein R3D28_24665 [Geminicoccaceae bacterium]